MAENTVTHRKTKSQLNDLTGHRFGRLVVLHRDLSRGIKPTRWTCLCDCGKTRDGIISSSLNRGRTKSCGCLHDEVAGARNRTHGKSHTPTHRTWAAMLTRCRNPNSEDFHHYGGRGITVCDRWNSFEAFLEDMGEKPKGMSIDRIDNSKGYYKNNCRWTTQTRQVRNKRNTVLLTHNGQTKPLADWCDELGVSYVCAKERMSKGWPSEQILSPTLFKTGPRVSPFKGKPRPNILRDPITKRFSGTRNGC